MAKQKRPRQTWWPLYTLGFIMIGLLILVHRQAPSPGWRIFWEVGVVVIGYGLMGLWLETHPNGLLQRPSAAPENYVVGLPQVEGSSPAQGQFYLSSDPAITDNGPEHLPSNGYQQREQAGESRLLQSLN